MDWTLGGYGFYVWGSYLIALVAMGGEVLALVKRTKSLRKQADRLPAFNRRLNTK
jgi:heme exporter protein D